MQLISQQVMYGFLGINIAMGYQKLPSWTDYWKGDQDLSAPYVSSVLPRNNHAIPEGNRDKLLTVQPLITQGSKNPLARLPGLAKIFVWLVNKVLC